MRLAIESGRVYDPLHGVCGEVRRICIDGARIVAGDGFQPDRILDATGRIVFPGGVDMHCHIAGPAVNRARRLLAGSGRWSAAAPYPLALSTTGTGLRYSLLGYTTAVEAAVAPSAARQCHLELADTPNLDRGFLLLLANHTLLLELLDRGEEERAFQVVAALVELTGAFGLKAVNPGGVAGWKSGAATVSSLSEPLAGRRVSPRAILELLAEAGERLSLPHPLHIHATGLGRPGNIELTLETSRVLEGRRHHLAHVQFHAYGAGPGGALESAARRFIDHFHAHPELTADVGQVMFGPALTLSADQELEHTLWRVTGHPYVNLDLELETGCGLVPLEYRPRSRVHALQWALGLELLLLAEDPWRLALSTDHPNGGSFTAYPLLIAHLMSRERRQEALALVPARALRGSSLPELSREYSLEEVAVVTRAGPARILGLRHKGHLGPGADADVTIYDDLEDREAMFRRPWAVLCRGRLVVEGGELRQRVAGRTFRAAVAPAPEGEARFASWWRRHASYDPARLGLAADEAARLGLVTAGGEEGP